MKIIAKCECSGAKFTVRALMVEIWVVDSGGDWERTVDADVFREPGPSSDFYCATCGEEAAVEL